MVGSNGFDIGGVELSGPLMNSSISFSLAVSRKKVGVDNPILLLLLCTVPTPRCIDILYPCKHDCSV